MSATRSPAAWIARQIATMFGAGFAPFASGTAGTLAAIPLVFAAAHLLSPRAYLVATLAVSLIGVWAAGRVERATGRHDPGEVVIDEVAGMFVTMVALPADAGTLVLGFILFRIMDVVKPPPAGRAERLPGGWGIVTDDLIAGVYANLALHGLRLLYTRLAG